MNISNNEKGKDIDYFILRITYKMLDVEVCDPAGSANWNRFCWKVKACIDRVQKEQAAPETQDWARFDRALDSALSTVHYNEYISYHS